MFDEVVADVISICSPHYLHKSMTLAAIERGFNVLVEKPMALKVEDAKEMIDATLIDWSFNINSVVLFSIIIFLQKSH